MSRRTSSPEAMMNELDQGNIYTPTPSPSAPNKKANIGTNKGAVGHGQVILHRGHDDRQTCSIVRHGRISWHERPRGGRGKLRTAGSFGGMFGVDSPGHRRGH